MQRRSLTEDGQTIHLRHQLEMNGRSSTIRLLAVTHHVCLSVSLKYVPL